MKLVTAIIKPFKVEEVRSSLDKIGVSGMTMTEVKGFGRQKGHTELYRGAEYTIDFLPKIKIEIAISDDMVDQVKNAIIEAAGSEKLVMGKYLSHLLRKLSELELERQTKKLFKFG